jgi:TolB-like protein
MSAVQPFHRIAQDQKEPRMARVTVEDCIDKVENRFDLVLISRATAPA